MPEFHSGLGPDSYLLFFCIDFELRVFLVFGIFLEMHREAFFYQFFVQNPAIGQYDLAQQSSIFIKFALMTDTNHLPEASLAGELLRIIVKRHSPLGTIDVQEPDPYVFAHPAPCLLAGIKEFQFNGVAILDADHFGFERIGQVAAATELLTFLRHECARSKDSGSTGKNKKQQAKKRKSGNWQTESGHAYKC